MINPTNIILPGDIIGFGFEEELPSIVTEVYENSYVVNGIAEYDDYKSIKFIKRSNFLCSTYKIFPKICEENLCPIKNLVRECDPQCKYFDNNYSTWYINYYPGKIIKRKHIKKISLSLRIKMDKSPIDVFFQNFKSSRHGRNCYNYYLENLQTYVLGGDYTSSFIEASWGSLLLSTGNYPSLNYDLEFEFLSGHKKFMTIEQTAIETKNQILSQADYLCSVCFIDNCKNCKLNDLRRNLQKI